MAHLPLLGLLLLLPSGLAGVLSRRVAGPPPAASKALGVDEPCPPEAVPEVARPLVVDMPAMDRADVELAMRDGLVLVQYDCHRLRIVPDCRVETTYTWAATNPKAENVRLDDQDEVRANLPFSGWGIAASLEGEFEKGASLDIAMVMVGKQRTTRAVVNRGDLVEDRPGACSTASHFVRGASIGAFTLSTGSHAAMGGAAEIKGIPKVKDMGGSASTSSERALDSSDGSVDACKGASSKDPEPPTDCSALLRLELTVVDPAGAPRLATPRDDDRVADLCPSGLVLAEGKCTAPRVGQAHLCAPDDLADCEAQCTAGDAGSCGRLAWYNEFGLAGARANPSRAATLYRQACDGGAPAGCAGLGSMLVRGEGVAPDAAEGTRLVEKACDMGQTDMCAFLAGAFYTGNLVARDPARAVGLAQRSCNGGSASGCFLLGELTRKGLGGLAADGARARELYRMSCYGGDPLGCYALGVALEDGIGGPASPTDARPWFQRGCDAGMKEACGELKK